MEKLICCPASRSSTGLKGPPASFYSLLLREMQLLQFATQEIVHAGLVCERYAQSASGRLFQLSAMLGFCDWWTSKTPGTPMYSWLSLVSTKRISPTEMKRFRILSDHSWAHIFGCAWNVTLITILAACCSCLFCFLLFCFFFLASDSFLAKIHQERRSSHHGPHTTKWHQTEVPCSVPN